MKKPTLKSLIVSILLGGSMILVAAQDVYASPLCSCIADNMSKQYQEYSEHWWGTRRAWSCEYTCESSAGVQKVTGYHKNWYSGKDDGREGVCDGIPFINEYNMFVQDFVWMPQNPEQFDPTRSTSPEIRAWAQSACR